MSKKLITLFSILMVAAMLLAACGPAATEEPTPAPVQPTEAPAPTEAPEPTAVPPTEAPEPTAVPPTEAPAGCDSPDVFCVGLVTDVGEVDDKSFNQSAWEGVLKAQAELGAQVKFIETKDAKDYGPNIELFASEGYDVIVTVGFALGTATAEEAAKYPDIKFIGVDQFQGTAIPNVVGLLFSEDKSGFLAGALAAMMSKTNTVAGVYGTDLVPPVVAFKVGYENGAAYINPDINVISTFHPGGLDVAFTDPEWGATTAKQAIDQGADVVFGAGGKTGNGALIEVAGNTGLYCIGVDTDQWETVPEAHPCLISSAMKLITPGVFYLIKAAQEGTFPSGNYVGAVGLAPFHDFESVIPQDVKDKLVEIDAALKDGSLSTGYTP
jgi:basic membrane protein A